MNCNYAPTQANAFSRTICESPGIRVLSYAASFLCIFHLASASTDASTTDKYSNASAVDAINKRGELWSGEVRITETMKRKEGESKSVADVLFDYSAASIRWIQSNDNTRSFKYVRNKNESALAADGSGSVSLYTPDHSINQPSMQPLDLRVVGLVANCEYDARWDFEKTLDFYNQASVTSEQTPDDAEFMKLVCESEGQGYTIRRTLTLDSTKAFAPSDLITQIQLKGQPTAVEDTHAKVEWSKVDNVWIPIRWDITASSGTIVRSLEFSWTRVNSIIQSDEFSLNALGLPDGTLINDNRFPTPKLVGVVGQKLQDGGLLPTTDKTMDDRNSTGLWLIGLNITIVLILAIIVALRRRRVASMARADKEGMSKSTD